jgi:hypothetical protein
MPGVAVAQKKKSEGLLQSLGGEVSTGVDEFRVLLFDTFASMYNSLVSALVSNFQKDNKKKLKKVKRRGHVPLSRLCLGEQFSER